MQKIAQMCVRLKLKIDKEYGQPNQVGQTIGMVTIRLQVRLPVGAPHWPFWFEPVSYKQLRPVIFY